MSEPTPGWKDIMRRHWCLILFVSIFIGLSIVSSISALAFNYLKGSLEYLIATAIATSLLILCGVALLNILITRIANEVNRFYAEKEGIL